MRQKGPCSENRDLTTAAAGGQASSVFRRKRLRLLNPPETKRSTPSTSIGWFKTSSGCLWLPHSIPAHRASSWGRTEGRLGSHVELLRCGAWLTAVCAHAPEEGARRLWGESLSSRTAP